MKNILIIGTVATKSDEIDFMRECIKNLKCNPVLMDVSVLGDPPIKVDYSKHDVAQHANMTNKEIIFTTSNRTDNSYFSTGNDYETRYYFQISIIDDWGYEVFSNIESIDPEYVTFIKSHDSGSEVDIGYRVVQTAVGKYKILGKTNSDVIMISTDRSVSYTHLTLPTNREV